jgi:AraC-like DNA-binding protein
MLTTESLLLILFSIPVYQMMFYTVQLVSLGRKNPARRYLGLLMLSMTAFLTVNAIHFLSGQGGGVLSHFLFFPLLLSIPPFFYLFIVSLLNDKQKPPLFQRRLVFLPAALVLVIHFLVFFLTPGHVRSQLTLLNLFSQPDLVESRVMMLDILLWFSGIGMLLVQLVLAIRQISPFFTRDRQKELQKNPLLSFYQPQWLMSMAIGVLIFIVVGALINPLYHHQNIWFAAGFNLALLTGGGVAGHYGMKMDHLFRQVAWLGTPWAQAIQNAQSGVAEKRNGKKETGEVRFITPGEAEVLQQNLITLMEEEKPYCSSSFSLGELCDMLNTNRRKLTYVINDVMQKNFYGVVNEYRVRESMRLLEDPEVEKFKMESIAEMAGFQSKSTFYACFKKYTGMTPTEYRMNVPESQEVPQVRS